MAGVSTTPEPRALASEMAPERVVSTRPVTPSAVHDVGVALVVHDERAEEHRRRRVADGVHLVDDLDQLLVGMRTEHSEHHTKGV